MKFRKKLPILYKKRKVQGCYFHGCDTWSLALREESVLKVYENRVLRIIFGPEGMSPIQRPERG
jgi:hypothetical protein